MKGKRQRNKAAPEESKAGDENDISEATSTRVCTHMNEDHRVTVFGMARQSVNDPPFGYQITDATLQRVSMKGCFIQTVFCKKEACQQRKSFFPFLPVLSNPSELRPRLITVHSEVCRPEYKPGLGLFFIFYMCLAWGTLYIGKIGMISRIEGNPSVRRFVMRLVFSSWHFAEVVYYMFYITLVAHTVMAFFVLYHGVRTLKLSTTTVTMWFLAVSLSGLSVTQDFREFLAFEHKYKAAKKMNKEA